MTDEVDYENAFKHLDWLSKNLELVNEMLEERGIDMRFEWGWVGQSDPHLRPNGEVAVESGQQYGVRFISNESGLDSDLIDEVAKELLVAVLTGRRIEDAE